MKMRVLRGVKKRKRALFLWLRVSRVVDGVSSFAGREEEEGE